MINTIPATIEDVRAMGWEELDIVIISGDALVDHPAFGTAVIARTLLNKGYRVAVIDQPDPDKSESVAVFGKPKLFFSVSSGNVDSMLMKYTAFKKVRNDDPFSPGGTVKNRCERAVIRYCNMIKQNYKDVPIVIGGVEASMRRLFHYDYWSNSARRSILEDSRADLLIYGMGEKQILQVAELLKQGNRPDYIYGTVIIKKNIEDLKDYILLDDEKDVIESKILFSDNYKRVIKAEDNVIVQPSGKRYIVQYPPAVYESRDLDRTYSLNYSREPHPKYKGSAIPAFDMIKFSINSHRGCASGCAFCSIYLHQGKRVISRSEQSILDEAKKISKMRYFRGHITDIGGPSANMYGAYCSNKKECSRTSCLFPARCKFFKTDQKLWLKLASKVSKLENVKHVTMGSGLRYDLFMKDSPDLLGELIDYVGGRLKIAPEHTDEYILKIMHKTPLYSFKKFISDFKKQCAVKNKKYQVIPYFMSNHPGSSLKKMKNLKDEISSVLDYNPEQVQSFIPLPMTLSSVMYWTGLDPETGESVIVEKDMNKKRSQHQIFFQDASRLKNNYIKKKNNKKKRNK